MPSPASAISPLGIKPSPQALSMKGIAQSATVT